MRIKEVAKQTGLTERTIRYYESVGLVIPDMEEKNWRLWRDYSPAHVRMLSAVATLRRASFSVEEISLLLSAPEMIPETVEKVRKRAEEARADAEKLCARLARPDLREAADVLALARSLEETASAIPLPTADRSYRYRNQERKVAEPRSLSASLASRLAVLVCVLWLLSMALLTFSAARGLGRQAAQESEKALDAFFEDLGSEASSLPEVRFQSGEGILTQREAGFALLKAALFIDERGIVRENDGFWTPSAVKVIDNFYKSAVEIRSGRAGTEELWLAVAAGKLCFMVDPNRLDDTVRLPNVNEGVYYRGFLTFRDAPHRGGSFFSGDADWYLPTVETKSGVRAGTYQTELVPYRAGTYDPGEKIEPGLFTPVFDEVAPSLELLNGLDSGEYRFDTDGVFLGSRLRGAWLRDGEGKPVRFLLAAYGWNPLAMALRLLPGVYAVSLAVFLLSGFFLWLALCRSLVLPLKAWDAALGAALLPVSPEEFDYACRYRELQDLAARYLLRRQMLEAVPPLQSSEGSDLLAAMDAARRKLTPAIDARSLEPAADYRTDGRIAAAPEALADALLALIREALPYGEQDQKLTLRTLEKEGFLLAEAEVRTKVLRTGSYAALWEGVYRLPGSGDAPGAKLRRASAAIPGSFCAVRKTKRGLCLTLGLPAAP
ncbi:MAG: MerR family transcriptional regulator [Oscillospiraceae bacterium]|nr:MerR family transcriptional regulator [Oscillospiraceae bacterium]